MSKHTPGPWTVVKSEGGTYGAHDFIGVTGPNSVRVADLTSRVRGSGPRSSADASLIAAAPDLLEALEKLAESVADMGGLNRLELSDLERAHAALAKARGGAR